MQDVEEETEIKFLSSSESSEEESESGEESGKEEKPVKKAYVMDPDLRMLLRNTKPLLQSRNSAVSYTLFSFIVYKFNFFGSTNSARDKGSK